MSAVVSDLVPLLERAPLRGRVDRERGVILSVKVVGRSSSNSHGVQGAEGTIYTMEALRAELPLIEGVDVNIDHPPRSRPATDRSARDRFAWLENATLTESGIYADLQFLDPADPLAKKRMAAAELRDGRGYALSHNAVGRGEVKDGRYVVTEIPEVHSVDIVAEGGTNRTLFEGKAMATTTGPARLLRRLVEMAGGEVSETGEPVGLMQQAEPPADEGPDELDHLFQAFKKCMKDNPERANKILKLLKAEEAEEGGEAEVEEEEGGEGQEEEEATESRGPRVPRPGHVHLTESLAIDLCRNAGLEPGAEVLRAIRGGSVEQALAILQVIRRAQATARAASPPRSSGRTGLQESALPRANDAKAWAQRLKS
jgi:hypothetical protein